MRPNPELGTIFAGYRLESQLGRGGMSVVYLAEQLRLGRKVAIKILTPELAEDGRFRERFVRESQLAASIDHPNVIPIYEAGEHEGVLYIAMRYVDGIDLRGLLRQEGHLEAHRAVAIVAQVASALDAAHSRGLTHRDVKPANVLLVPHGGSNGSDHAYLADFGLTKHQASRSSLTLTGQFLGTIDYIAPEQIEGKQVDGRADIYALGCVFYELLTGMPPYQKESEVAVMYAHLRDAPPVVTARRTDLPPVFDDIVATAMAKDRELRYQSGSAMTAAASRAIQAAPAAPPPLVADPTVAQNRPRSTPALLTWSPSRDAAPPQVPVYAPPPLRPPDGGRQFAPAVPPPPPPPPFDPGHQQAGGPLPASRRGLSAGIVAAIIVAGLALAGGVAFGLSKAFGSGGSSSSSSNAGRTPSLIVSDAAAALSTVRSFRVIGTTTSSDGTIALDLQVDSGKLKGTVTTGATTAQIVIIGDTVFLQGHDFFAKFAGQAAANTIGDRWVSLSAARANLGDITRLTHPDQVARCSIQGPHGTLAISGTSSIDGHPTVQVQDAGDMPGTTPGTVDVATDGAGYPIRFQTTGPPMPGGSVLPGCELQTSSSSASSSSSSVTTASDIRLSQFNDSFDITAPQGAIDFTQVSGG